MTNTAMIGRTSGPYTLKGNVLTQMNDTAGALWIPVSSKYPVAAAMMQPTRRPMTTAVDFMMGAPYRSDRMMVRKTERPRPRYSADPHGSAWGARMFGHLAKKSVVGW